MYTEKSVTVRVSVVGARRLRQNIFIYTLDKNSMAAKERVISSEQESLQKAAWFGETGRERAVIGADGWHRRGASSRLPRPRGNGRRQTQ